MLYFGSVENHLIIINFECGHLKEKFNLLFFILCEPLQKGIM